MTDAKMADGTILRFPDGTPDDVIDRAVKEHLSKSQAQPTLQQRTQEAMGLDPTLDRATILPFAKNQQGGTEFAWPQMAVSAAEAVMAPSHVMQGGDVTSGDVLNTAAFMTGTPPSSRAISTKIPPPTTGELKAAGQTAYKVAEGSGITLSPKAYKNFVVEVERFLTKEGISEKLHPKLTGILHLMASRLGSAPDMKHLDNLYKELGQAKMTADSGLARERMLSGMTQDLLDEYVRNLKPADLAGLGMGSTISVKEAQAALDEARLMWARAAKSQEIETAMYNAKLAASGFENGLRNEFRSILKDESRARNFTPAEIKVMEGVVNGTITTKALRVLGKFGFGTSGSANWLGGMAGGGMGYAAGGPVGAAATVATGMAAQRAALFNTKRQAQSVRTMAALGGKPLPKSSVLGASASAMARTAPALGGTLLTGGAR